MRLLPALLLALSTLMGSQHNFACSALPPPPRSYNILMLLPVSSKSHRNVFMPLATALAERGHKITMLAGHPVPQDNLTMTYIDHGLPHFREENRNVFDVKDDPAMLLEYFSVAFSRIARDIYALPEVQKLYEIRKQFDLIIVNSMFNELIYPFVHGQPFISISTAGLEPMQSAVLGNVLNPAYTTTLLRVIPSSMTVLERAANIFNCISHPLEWRNKVLPRVNEEVSKHFPDLPPLLEMERNQSLVLLNSHFSLSTPLPLLPGQVEVGCMHCRSGKPLPKDLETFIAGSTPVVYFSLGSIVRGTTMPVTYLQMLLSAFSKLPYKFMWKFEKELSNLPKNVMIRPWLPQQDILAHTSVKLFISHCGLLSSQEATYHGKPVLGLPVFFDQPKNALRFENNGMGKSLRWETLSEEMIMNAIETLITDKSYQTKISAVSSIFKDQLETPVDRAVFWTEYVIRHSGAVHLRSPQRDLSWREFLNLDIIVLAHLFVFLVVKILKTTFRFCFGSKGKKTKKNKRD